MSAMAGALHAAAAEPDSGPPPLPRRLLDAFFSPGKMAREVAADPRWAGALLVCIALIALGAWLTPPELLAEMQRRAALERGVEMPAMTDRTLRIIHIASVVGGSLAFGLMSFLLPGLYTVVFAFVLGDEGRYKQYLAVFAHAAFIPALLSVALVPLRIASEDVRFSLSLASFAVSLPGGYLLNVLRMMDLTQIWATLVVALGVRAIDDRRSFASAAAILLVMQLAVALVVARFIPG